MHATLVGTRLVPAFRQSLLYYMEAVGLPFDSKHVAWADKVALSLIKYYSIPLPAHMKIG